jgi:hypothetical protein
MNEDCGVCPGDNKTGNMGKPGKKPAGYHGTVRRGDGKKAKVFIPIKNKFAGLKDSQDNRFGAPAKPGSKGKGKSGDAVDAATGKPKEKKLPPWLKKKNDESVDRMVQSLLGEMPVMEATFTAGASVKIFCPAFVSAHANDNGMGDYGVEAWLDEIDNASGGYLKDEVQRFMNSDDGEDVDPLENEGGEEGALGHGEGAEPEGGPMPRGGEMEDDRDPWERALDRYVESNFGGKWYKFLEELGEDHVPLNSSSIDDELASEGLEAAAADWNESQMQQYLEAVPGCRSAVAEVTEHGGNRGLAITFTFSKPLNPDQIDQVKSWVNGQMSDGWGEGFEQQTLGGGQRGNRDRGLFEYSMHFWTSRPHRESDIAITGQDRTDPDVVAGAKRLGNQARQAFRGVGNRVRQGASEIGRRVSKASQAIRGESDEKVNAMIDQLLDS